MLILQSVTYTHPNRDILFSDINLVINTQDKIALIGNNGAGKSTLLRLIAGELEPASGQVKTDSKPYYVPQLFGHLNEGTVAEALGIKSKLDALRAILDGDVTETNLTELDDDWAIEQRCKEAFDWWQLPELDLLQTLGTLSGGQKTKVFLAGIMIHRPEIVLLDEPSNHLDTAGRELLYKYISTAKQTLVIVSHDRTVLNLLNTTIELDRNGLTVYGGNYNFYAEQKAIEKEALEQDLKTREKALRKAKETEREALERQQKLDARGKKKQEKAGLPTISMNTFRNNAEKSTARIKDVHAEKVNAIVQELNELRKEMPEADRMRMELDNSKLHKGKVLATAKDLNAGYDGRPLWKEALTFQLLSGERIAIKGPNGSGKTTLVKIILGQLQPPFGAIEKAAFSSIYIDQDYSLIRDELRVYQQAELYNSGQLQEHEIRIRLARFLFTKEDWDKPCAVLSGGEKMRLVLCCLTIANQAPDVIILDEPTNNLDIQNIGILTAAINDYKGTLLVISHDEVFLQEINVERVIELS